MKFFSVTTPPVSKAIPNLVKIGLVVLMFMPASIVVADNTPNTTAPAAAKPETTATNPVKPAPCNQTGFINPSCQCGIQSNQNLLCDQT